MWPLRLSILTPFFQEDWVQNRMAMKKQIFVGSEIPYLLKFDCPYCTADQLVGHIHQYPWSQSSGTGKHTDSLLQSFVCSFDGSSKNVAEIGLENKADSIILPHIKEMISQQSLSGSFEKKAMILIILFMKVETVQVFCGSSRNNGHGWVNIVTSVPVQRPRPISYWF